MRLRTNVLNPPAIVDALNTAGIPARMVDWQSPNWHIAVDAGAGDRDRALAVARSIDEDVEVWT